MEFVGFSFHFQHKPSCVRALAEVAKLGEGRAARGIDPSTLVDLGDGFYIGWKSGVTCGGARSWLSRIPGAFKRTAAVVKMCGHHLPPGPLLDHAEMTLLTTVESGYRLNFYQIPHALGEAVVADAASASVASSATFSLQSRTLGEVAAAIPGVKEIINAPCACWSLGLLRRDPILAARSKLYTVGPELGNGTNGVVYQVTFNGNGGANVCAKLLRCDDEHQSNVRIEVYALERANDSPSGICRLLDVFVKPGQRVYLVMELWPSDLFHCFEEVAATPLQIRSALRGPMEGLRFLHDRLILVHCDVKSANILVKPTMAAAVPDVEAVLGDLGSVMEVCL